MLDEDKTIPTDTLAPHPDMTEGECKVEGMKNED